MEKGKQEVRTWSEDSLRNGKELLNTLLIRLIEDGYEIEHLFTNFSSSRSGSSTVREVIIIVRKIN